MTSAFSEPPSIVDLESVARAILATIPQPLSRFVENVVIRVEDFVDEETGMELGLESPFDLLGLYRGVNLKDKSVTDIAQDIDMIFLYRRPILDAWCDSGDTLASIIRHVLIHEIGHHFGLSDEDMERIEEQE
jgi:predicted Zn-dependent protease with MMP-like domain